MMCRGDGGLELELADELPEGLALDGSELELEGRGLARAIGAGEGSSTPWRA